MVRRLGLVKNNHLTYTSLALNPRYAVYSESVFCMYGLIFLLDLICRWTKAWPRSGHRWESQVLLLDGQVVFHQFLQFWSTFDERSAQYKWNILERAIKPKSKKKKKKRTKACLKKPQTNLTTKVVSVWSRV